MSRRANYGEKSEPPSSSTSPAPSTSRGSYKFPQKLWDLVEDNRENSITWTKDGETILIDFVPFQHRFLNKKSTIFKTTNMASFIRQLNLYGFRKVNNQTEIHEYKHPSFKRGRPDLLISVTRRYQTLQTATSINHLCEKACQGSEYHLDGHLTSLEGNKWQSTYFRTQRGLDCPSTNLEQCVESSYLPYKIRSFSPESGAVHADYSDTSCEGRFTPTDLRVSTRKFSELSIPNTGNDDKPLDFTKHNRSDDYRQSFIGSPHHPYHYQSQREIPSASSASSSLSNFNTHKASSFKMKSFRPSSFSPTKCVDYDEDEDDNEKLINVEDTESDEEEEEQEASKMAYRYGSNNEESKFETRKVDLSNLDDSDEEDISKLHKW